MSAGSSKLRLPAGGGEGCRPDRAQGHLCCLFYLSFSKFDKQEDPRGKEVIRSHDVKWHVCLVEVKGPLGICMFSRGFGYRQVPGLGLNFNLDYVTGFSV